MNRVAVVGGGIFGCTTAWMLAKEGFSVDLFEKYPRLFQATSSINQFRLHRGYHYPRSKETMILSKEEESSFLEHYKDATDVGNDHFYCIAKEKTLSTKAHCQKVWKEVGLEFEEAELGVLNMDKLDYVAKVKESIYDPFKLKEICENKLAQYGVKIHLNHEVRLADLKNFDKKIIATYAHNNHFLPDNAPLKQYQFELCEKIVVKLPAEFTRKSIVILDGPFMCIDPYSTTGNFVMGNVVHAIHHTNTGEFPEIPEAFLPLINKGVIQNPPITNYDKFIESASEFFPGVVNAKHVGSMYTIRTVPPGRDHDDARPTYIESLSDDMISVFSGKVGTCVWAAEKVIKCIKGKKSVGAFPQNDTSQSGNESEHDTKS